MPRRHECGQSLLEVTISIGVAVIVIAALTIVTISGLKNSEFSQNQAIATKLAQDWLEQVRAIRDRNGMVCNPGTYYQWLALWNTSCSPTSSTCYNFTVNTTTTLPNCGQPDTFTPSSPYLSFQPSANFQTPDSQYPQFKKQLLITDYVDSSGVTHLDQKKVTVTVSWTDSSGTHQSNLVTILTKL